MSRLLRARKLSRAEIPPQAHSPLRPAEPSCRQAVLLTKSSLSFAALRPGTERQGTGLYHERRRYHPVAAGPLDDLDGAAGWIGTRCNCQFQAAPGDGLVPL